MMTGDLTNEELIDRAVEETEKCLHSRYSFAIPQSELPRLKEALLRGETFSIQGELELPGEFKGQTFTFLCDVSVRLNNQWSPSWAYMEVVAAADKNIKEQHSFCLTLRS